MAVLGMGGTFTIMEEGQTLAFQQHLFSIRKTFIDLNALPGINASFIPITPPRPQLTDVLASLCQTLVNEVDLEIIVHDLVAFTPDDAPWAHDPLSPSSAPHRTGGAFDAFITGLTEAEIDLKATAAGLHRPNPATEPFHFEP